ncbi:MAG: ChrR family anti-sigma-E factor [Tistlia sp.]|uniref:ChrR family anti-sigma-E factor n=1 Tax=Tistlia sp. TaxID=3057121 RepID=UPI0034A143AA
MTTHPAPDELLLAHAAGGLDQLLSLIVASQAAYSEDSRRRLCDFEALGGLLLEELEPAPLDEGALETLLDRLDAVPQEAPARTAAAPAPAEDGFDLPPVLRRLLGDDLRSLAWQPLMRGVRSADLVPGVRESGGPRARLMRIEAGTAVARHSHRGREFTLVLSGAYSDAGGTFGPGDLQISDASVDHRPRAIGSTPCLCLVVTDAPLRLTGPLGLLNPFLKSRL